MRALGPYTIHPVAFGAMNLSIEGRPPREQAIATLRAAVEAGAELIDTADVYGEGERDALHNVRLVAEAKTGARVSTKVGVRREGDRWIHDGRPDHLRRAAEASLRALGTEAIDLLHLHAVDERVPLEDSVGELSRLVDEGKARAIGVSNVSPLELDRALQEAPIVSVQNEASPFVAPDPEVLRLCAERRIAFLAYAPMGGWRAGRLAHELPLEQAGERVGASPFEVVIAALLAHAPEIIVLAGASGPAKARSSVRAASLELAPQDRDLMRRYWR